MCAAPVPVGVSAGRWWRRLLPLVTGSLIVAVTGLELLSRRFAPAASPFERRFPVELTRRPLPYTMFGGVPGARIVFGEGRVETLNALGYRGRSAETPRLPGELRVFVVGGSTVFVGERSIPDLLEDELRRRGIAAATVFNYGVVSSVSGQDLARVLFEVADEDPDLVIFYGGGNDLLSPALYDPRPGYPFNFIAQENNPLLRRDVRSYPALDLFAYGSNVARAMFGSYFVRQFADIDACRRAAGYGQPEWKRQIVLSYVGRLEKAQRVSRAFGADFIGFFQPLIYFKPHLAPAEAPIVQQSAVLARLAAELRADTRLEIERAQRRSGLHMVDLSDLFEAERGETFLDWIHTLPEGERKVARVMADSAEPLLRERMPRAGAPPRPR